MIKPQVAKQHDHILFDRIANICKGNPRVAILMSGTGSNTQAILEQKHRYPNLNFAAIATDELASQASLIASQYKLSFIFAKHHDDHPWRTKSFFYDLADKLRYLNINFLVYAGFMKIVPPAFLIEFPGINIHPADLTIKDKTGVARYRGLSVIQQALVAGEQYIASTVHIVEAKADCGLVIAISKHLPLATGIIYNADKLHKELKLGYEHILYPQVLTLLGSGRLSYDQLPLRAEYQDLDIS